MTATELVYNSSAGGTSTGYLLGQLPVIQAQIGDWFYYMAISTDDGVTAPMAFTLPNDPNSVIEYIIPNSFAAVSPSISWVAWRVKYTPGFDGQYKLTNGTGNGQNRTIRYIYMVVRNCTEELGRHVVGAVSTDVPASGPATAMAPGMLVAGQSGLGLVLAMNALRNDASVAPGGGTYTAPYNTITRISYWTQTSAFQATFGKYVNVASGTTTNGALITSTGNPYAGRIPGSAIGVQFYIPSLDDDTHPIIAPGYDNKVSIGDWFTTDGPVPYPDDSGNLFVLQQIEGWFGGVAVRAASIDKPLADGAFDGPAPFTGRQITLTGTLVSPSRFRLQEAFDTLAGVLAGSQRVGTLEVYERVRELTRIATVRLDGPTMIERTTDVTAKFSLVLFASDPNRYSSDITTVSWMQYKISGGRTYNLTFPRTYGAAGTSGQTTVFNGGDRESWPIFSIPGPVKNPVVQILGGPKLQLAGDVLAGETLVIDTYRRTVQVGDLSRRLMLTSDSEWFSLPPGTTILYFAQTTLGSQMCTVAFREAYS